MTNTLTDAANARAVATDALLDFELQKDYADELLSVRLNGSELQGSDRALAADLYWGVIRWHGRLDAVIQPTFNGDYYHAAATMRVLLRLGGYQLFVQDRIPDHAAVSQTVELAVQRLGKPAAGLVNAILRKLARERERWDQVNEALDEWGKLAVHYSHPRWIVKLLAKLVGPDKLAAALEANNQRSALSIRINGSADKVVVTRSALFEAGVKFQPSRLLSNYVHVGSGMLPLLRPFLEQGEITVQDESAGMAVDLLAPVSGDAILDFCAAPGGKTLAILDKIGDTGTLVANDKSAERVELLRQNLDRVEARGVEVIVGDARAIGDRQFDKVLVDAPCSALGLLRRQPDVRWRRRREHIPAQVKEQIEILRSVAAFVKPGGVLVYSTCSILPAENHEMVAQFMKEFPDFRHDDAQQFLPEAVVSSRGDLQTFTHIHDCDGAYAARLCRKT